MVRPVVKALVLLQPSRFVYEEVATPAVGPHEVLVAVKACGICGSDVHGMDGSTDRRRPPVVMGHEASGIVMEVGADVEGWGAGDRVTFDSTISCGECAFCLEGLVNLCDQREVLGVSCADYRRNGAFAEYVAVPSRVLYRLPDRVTFHQATMVEPLAVALHAVERLGSVDGDTALVVGTGIIGLLVVQTLLAQGCKRVLAFDLDEGRLRLAEDLGAEPMRVPPAAVADAVRSRTDGRGADVALEVVGTSPAVRTALAALRKRGRLVLVGNVSPTIDLPLQDVVTREIVISGSAASAGEYPRALELIATGAIDVNRLITAVVPLHDAGAWFKRLYDREGGLLKVVVEPHHPDGDAELDGHSANGR